MISNGITVGSAAERPGETFIAVRSRDHWCAIDDRDLSSERLCSCVLFICTFVETGGK